MRLRSMVVGVTILVACASAVRAEGISIGAQAGGGHYAFGDLEDAWNDFGIENDTDDLGFGWEFYATWSFAQRHAARVSVGRIGTSVSLHTLVLADPFSVLVAELDLKTIPICLSYEFALRESGGGARTLLGVGGGFYISEIETTEFDYSEDPLLEFGFTSNREGNGYGVHGYLRQTAPISERLALSGMISGRWVDALAFEDDDGSVAADFSGVDFALGLEWKL